MKLALVDELEVTIFDSIEEVESYIEPPEVIEGKICLFDENGKTYDLCVEKVEKKNKIPFLGFKTEVVRIMPSGSDELKVEEKRDSLLEFILYLNLEIKGDSSLSSLIRIIDDWQKSQ